MVKSRSISTNNNPIKVQYRLSKLQKRILLFLKKKEKNKTLQDSHKVLNSITDTKQIYKNLLPYFAKKIEYQFIDMEKRLKEKYSKMSQDKLKKIWVKEIGARSSLSPRFRNFSEDDLEIKTWVEKNIKWGVKSARRKFNESFLRNLFLLYLENYGKGDYNFK